MKIRVTRLLPLSVLLALVTAIPGWAQAHPATPTVETLHAAFVDVMKNAESLGYQGRYDKLGPAIAEAYDLDFMAEKVVGRHWKTMSGEEKARWLELFSTLTVANYAGRFTGHSGEYFETVSFQPAAHDTVLVQTTLVLSNGKVIEFNYRLHQDDGSWKIIDIYMNGTVSELALRRSDFSATLKREGFEELASSVGARIAELEADGDSLDTIAAKVSE